MLLRTNSSDSKAYAVPYVLARIPLARVLARAQYIYTYVFPSGYPLLPIPLGCCLLTRLIDCLLTCSLASARRCLALHALTLDMERACAAAEAAGIETHSTFNTRTHILRKYSLCEVRGSINRRDRLFVNAF